ncbi:hypothetical protein ONS95_003063 [Cadophora gregata]|uniref:uncharacterized protein n=1 Tax=Cadophora gregata TaxID=51156 RepID=UPI0026DD57BA|nr:uncharacterized protein ONS95_003063 [Cadophora gregata]KAK0108245.1 hypothetical protein ONS95_003063 [Cadophora gregata]KAK0109165.1 hypothetical protein ONS96_002988 [Cadophora gregata f. sp. sojae]
MAEPNPFKISVSDDLLSFITQRVTTARLPPGIDLPASEAWSHGVPEPVMSRLQQYWANKYDWRAVEARINSQLKMFTLPINHEGEELTMHFVHHRSSREGAIPLLFQHGWPGNFLEVEKIIDDLVEPKEEGKQAYHVVAPSLPGFVFSEMSKRPEFGLGDIAHMEHKLMTALGYERYMGQGGDWGSIIVRAVGKLYPEHCVAVHVNMVISGLPPWTSPLTFIRFIAWAIWQDKSKDGSLFGRMMWWQKEENGRRSILISLFSFPLHSRDIRKSYFAHWSSGGPWNNLILMIFTRLHGNSRHKATNACLCPRRFSIGYASLDPRQTRASSRRRL